jgi:hypothetical protein
MNIQFNPFIVIDNLLRSKKIMKKSIKQLALLPQLNINKLLSKLPAFDRNKFKKFKKLAETENQLYIGTHFWQNLPLTLIDHFLYKDNKYFLYNGFHFNYRKIISGLKKSIKLNRYKPYIYICEWIINNRTYRTLICIHNSELKKYKEENEKELDKVLKLCYNNVIKIQ